MTVDTDTEMGFFEGAEKLLEIWFEGLEGDTTADLRRIPRHELDDLLKYVNAEIMSVAKNNSIDSYILSESSMFISAKRFIIKTCGITKLLLAVQPCIQLAYKHANMLKVHNFFYSRRVFLRPEEQVGVHKKFDDEVAFLDEIIPHGSAYVLGCVPSQQWYMYTTDNHAPAATPTDTDDVTLEILMSDLDHNVMQQFSKLAYTNPDELIVGTGISRFIPRSVNDGMLFDPIGFSMNGLHEDAYYTIHVTPQDSCSYVSFETNIVKEDYSALINRVVETFKPGKFVITFFSAKGAPCGAALTALQRVDLDAFVCADQSHENLKNYSVAYQHYVKR